MVSFFTRVGIAVVGAVKLIDAIVYIIGGVRVNYVYYYSYSKFVGGVN